MLELHIDRIDLHLERASPELVQHLELHLRPALDRAFRSISSPSVSSTSQTVHTVPPFSLANVPLHEAADAVARHIVRSTLQGDSI